MKLLHVGLAALVAVPGSGTLTWTAPASAAPNADDCLHDTYPTRGATMEYYECHRNGTQTALSIRVKDTRNDKKCAWARGAIGNTKKTAITRIRVHSCSKGHWSAWKRSGWWTARDGYEYVWTHR